ncbi:MAG: LPS-assembly protein LptD [Planctomycetes bacterium]|nr:LPS-assembly protein LptD [Planctomycetota bacterium]
MISVPAQDKTPTATTPTAEKPSEELAAYIHYGHLERWKEDNTQITAFTNKVELYQANRLIKADTLITWSKETPAPVPPPAGATTPTATAPAAAEKQKDVIFDEVYAEGNISVITEDTRMYAERLYYNFADNTGVIINAEIRTTAEVRDGKSTPVILRSLVVYQTDKNTLLAKNCSVTTCPHGQPHYYVWAAQVKFVNDEKGKRLAFTHIIPHIWGIPFFWFPYYHKTVGDDPLLRSVHMERSERFGRTVIALVGYNINRYERDEKGALIKDKNGQLRLKRWGDLTLEGNFSEKRGAGWKPELKYRWQNYQGYLKAYYINDKGPDPANPYDAGIYAANGETMPAGQQERSRIKVFHRQQFNANLRADLEYYSISDRMVLPEFFDREYREEKTPETYLYLRHLRNNTGLAAMGRFRINEFQTQTEYLPRAKYYLFSHTLPAAVTEVTGPVYYSGSLELNNSRLQYDEKTGLPSRSVARFDSYNEVSMSRQMDFLRVTPFISGRLTGYDQTISATNYADRFVGSGGVRLLSQFSRIFDIQNKLLGMNTIKHNVTFDIRYADNYKVTLPQDNLIATDDTNRLAEFREWYLEVRNRFKTKRGDSYSDFLNIGLSLERYPAGKRDTTAINQNTYLYPMSWITISPTNTARDISNVNLDLLVTPNLPFTVSSRAEYNTDTKRTEVLTAGVTLTPYTGWSVSMTERYIMDKSNALGVALNCALIEKWQVAISDQYDFERQTFTNRLYSFKRDLHEFFLEFSIAVDKGKDEKVLNILLQPKGIFAQ